MKTYEDIEKQITKSNYALLKELTLLRNFYEGVLDIKKLGKVKIIERTKSGTSFIVGLYDKNELKEEEAENIIVSGENNDKLIILRTQSPLSNVK